MWGFDLCRRDTEVEGVHSDDGGTTILRNNHEWTIQRRAGLGRRTATISGCDTPRHHLIWLQLRPPGQGGCELHRFGGSELQWWSRLRFQAWSRVCGQYVFDRGSTFLGEPETTGVVPLAGCCVTSWSRTQASYALSCRTVFPGQVRDLKCWGYTHFTHF